MGSYGLAFASPAFGADIYVSNNSSLPQRPRVRARVYQTNNFGCVSEQSVRRIPCTLACYCLVTYQEAAGRKVRW
jgi:hypothetical protein